MNCKVAPAGPKPAVCRIPKPNQSSKARIPESISFASQSQVWRSRILMNNASGPREARSRARVEAIYSVSAAESLYQVLGIEESVSSISDIKKAYKQMARKYHPDVSPPERVDENTRRFIMVKQAYETLSNPQRRALYDKNLGRGHHHQEIEERGDWKMTWQSQLEELKRRSDDTWRRGSMSWGAKMRTNI